ncbi:hypothetical protein IW245_000691 [Longispora fulva]|uniref:Uncharacterized protein n=2 Tax=Longispora fulva TaxID=619741 RepID=A0A8J7GDJ7_9ACTN|nr:hypothetical protein [Longispora fulva]
MLFIGRQIKRHPIDLHAATPVSTHQNQIHRHYAKINIEDRP